MTYTKQNFTNGQTLKAEHLNNIESGIIANEAAIEELFNKIAVDDGDNTGDNITAIEYTYDGDNESDAHTWVRVPNGAKAFLKVADVPDGGIDLVGGDVSVLVPEWPTNNYTFTITDEMLKTVNGLTQVLYQHAASSDQTTQAMVVICTKAGEYTIDLNGWSENLNFAQTGIYFMDSREMWGGKYVESLIRSGTNAPDVPEEIPTEYNGNEVQVFNRGLCIGDSITQGTYNHSGGADLNKDYSYPTYFKRMTGVNVVNAGIAGFTSQTWYDASIDCSSTAGRWIDNEWRWTTDTGNTSLDYTGFDFAIIHLGINDVVAIGGDNTLETALATFSTNINNIITKLKESNTGIKIFLATIIPCYAFPGDANYAAFNEKIREIANSTDDVYLVDLNAHSELVYGTPYENQHLTAIGYWKMASEISSYISYIISNNLEDFKWIQFTGTDYTA